MALFRPASDTAGSTGSTNTAAPATGQTDPRPPDNTKRAAAHANRPALLAAAAARRPR